MIKAVDRLRLRLKVGLEELFDQGASQTIERNIILSRQADEGPVLLDVLGNGEIELAKKLHGEVSLLRGNRPEAGR